MWLKLPYLAHAIKIFSFSLKTTFLSPGSPLPPQKSIVQAPFLIQNKHICNVIRLNESKVAKIKF